jgi:APA family basic amino acid/polyamine antiporter
MAVAIIVILTTSNLFGLRQSSRLQNVLTATKVSALVLIVVAGVMSSQAASCRFDPGDLMRGDLKTLTAMCLALVPILWTYGGWRDNVFLAGDTKDARRSVPFALLTTCIVITVIYVAMNVLYLWFIPVKSIAGAPLVAADVLKLVFSDTGAKVFEGLIVVYAVGVINGLLLTGSYLAKAMASDNPLFQYLNKTDERTGTHRRALIFNGIWSCLLVLSGSFEMLLYFTGLWVWIFFAMVAVAVIIFRRRGVSTEERFNMPGYPVIPLIVAAVSLLLAASTVTYLPKESLWGTLIVLSGLPFFQFQKSLKPV